MTDTGANAMAHATPRTVEERYHATFTVINGKHCSSLAPAQHSEYRDFCAPTDLDAAFAACILTDLLANGAPASEGNSKPIVTLISLVSPAYQRVDVSALLRERACKQYTLTAGAAKRPFEDVWNAMFPDGNYHPGCSPEEKALRKEMGF